MKFNEQMSTGILSRLVHEVMGEEWNISPLTEISRFIELKGFHLCNMYVYKLCGEKVIDKAHHCFAFYDNEVVSIPVELQVTRTLHAMRDKITCHKTDYQQVFFE